ncbi:hypothetical protein [Prevotella sp.]|uniref:hypothetical protein n=1 Tax=Prevotella sp. TaxID=59823 RepID=UPI0027E25FFD|nr:hypothetical protein [Prevotella sp.]
METILLKHLLCMMCVIGVVTLIACLFWLWREFFRTWREKKAKQKEGCQQQKKTTCLPEPPLLLTPKERREYMLNHIEDGRFYAISSLRGSDTTIVCAERYDTEEQRLYCYAYLSISGRGDYNLHIIAPIGKTKFCDFLGKKRLRIDLDLIPRCVVFEEENISPYITDREYNTFVQSLQTAGFDWKIEKGKENVLGSYKYFLKGTRTK